MVAGDLDNPEKVKAAFKGANVIFGTTDFWQYFGSKKVQEQAEKEGRSPNEVAYEVEVRQGESASKARVLR